MPGLTNHQSSIIQTLFAAAPDSAVRQLEQALAADCDQGGSLAEVHMLIAREANERRVRTAVLGPVIPLCRSSQLGDKRFPGATIPRLWIALRYACPDLVAAAEAAVRGLEANGVFPDEIYDALCARAADGLRAADPAYAEVTRILAGDGPDSVAMFVDYLDLVPLARAAVARLPEWLGRMSEERAASARLAYKDAVALSDDAGPRFVEVLLTHLPEPWLILRILAVVVIGANDRYLADSELGRFGDYILDDIDRRLAAFRAFDPDQGRRAGMAAAEYLHGAAQAISEFENALDISRDGPWGVRVARQKQMLAELAEARLAQIDKVLGQALPLQMVRFGRGLRGMPKLVADPDPRLVRRAEGLMGFFDHSRTSASSSGFGSARAKVGEIVEARLDQYVEDLLEALRAEEVRDADRVHAYLEAAAALMGDARGEKAAQIVRRRAAAA
jgi:hypothetical protein